jgi:hypothetical protein
MLHSNKKMLKAGVVLFTDRIIVLHLWGKKQNQKGFETFLKCFKSLLL